MAGLLVWGFSFGQARVARTRVRVAIPGLAPALDGLRVVQISDLHIGNGLQGERLTRMVERTNALRPDLIVITGDIFDFDPAFIDDGLRRLAQLHARCGVYAILGNHDVYTGTERVVAGFAALAPAIRLLRDEIVKLPLPESLYLAGVEDPGPDWSARGLELPAIDRLAGERPGDGPTLLLVHRPEAFPQAARLGFPLVLAGHTHGGQLALPTPGGPWNLARIVTRFTRGRYQLESSTLYVTRGVGVGGPALRVNCSREITTLELNWLRPESEVLLEHVHQSVAAEAGLLVGAHRRAVDRREHQQRRFGAGLELARERPGRQRRAEAAGAQLRHHADEGHPDPAGPVRLQLDEGDHAALGARHAVRVATVAEHRLHPLAAARPEAAGGIQLEDGVRVARLGDFEREIGGRRLGGETRAFAAHQEVLAHRTEAMAREQRVAAAIARADAGGRQTDAELLRAERDRLAQQLAAQPLAALVAPDDRAEHAGGPLPRPRG